MAQSNMPVLIIILDEVLGCSDGKSINLILAMRTIYTAGRVFHKGTVYKSLKEQQLRI